LGKTLLIAPKGIEIKKSQKMEKTNQKLLIAPKGIEISFPCE